MWNTAGARRDGTALRQAGSVASSRVASAGNYEDVEKEGPGKHRDQTNPFTVVDVTGDRERFMEGLFWHFGGRPRRMSKAIRIEYTYKGDDDKEYKPHLLIGYEGAGGGM